MRDVDDIPERELAVELDRAIDHRIEAQAAKYNVEQVYVLLDSAADGELPTEPQMKMREMQETAEEIIDALAGEVEAASERADAVRERMQE